MTPERLQRSPAEMGARMGLAFGVLNGVLFALASAPFLLLTGPFVCVLVPMVFVFTTLLTGPLFGAMMAAFAAAAVHEPKPAAGEALRAWGGANRDGNGGVLALSDQRLWYATHGFNFARPDFDLPLAAITGADFEAGLLSDLLHVRTASRAYTLRVESGERWAQAIAAARARAG